MAALTDKWPKYVFFTYLRNRKLTARQHRHPI
jgi:hypothetical protein